MTEFEASVLGNQVADLLGPGWRYCGQDPDTQNHYIRHRDGRAFFIVIGTAASVTHHRVVGNLPHHLDGRHRYMGTSGLNISVKKSCVRIAKEIEARLLPELTTLHEKALIENAQEQENIDSRSDFGEHIEALWPDGWFPSQPDRGEFQYSYTVPVEQGGSAKIRYAGRESVQLEFRSIRPDLALAIARTVHEFVAKEQEKANAAQA